MNAASPTAQAREASSSRFRKDWLLRYSTLFVLILLFMGFALTVDRFLTTTNLLNIVQQISMLTIVGAGLTFGFAAREMDLAVGYMVGLSGILVPLMLVSVVPLPVALLTGVGAGLLVGVINATLVTLVGVPSLIATLATGSILYGVNFLTTGGRAIYGGLPDTYLWFGQGQLFGIPVLAYAMILFVALAWFVMERTIFGRYIYAVGGNPHAAKTSGLNVTRIRFMAYVISGALSGLAGMILSARTGSALPQAGIAYELDAIAAVVIGGTSLSGGVGRVTGTLIGALIIGVMNNGLDLMGIQSYYQQVLKGALIVGAVMLDQKRNQGL